MNPEIETITHEFEAAQETYNTALEGLRKPDGRPLYAPDEEARRRNVILATYTAAQQAATDALQRIVAEAEKDLSSGAVGDPLTRLKPAELEQANQLRVFISEDFQRLPSAMLTQHCQDELKSGDTVRIALALRYARQALATRFTAAGEAYDLKKAVADIEETFVDKSKRDKAKAIIDAVGQEQTKIIKAKYLQQAHSSQRRVA